MSNKTVIHIIKSFLAALTLQFTEYFEGVTIVSVLASLIFALFLQLIPLLLYSLTYLFSKNKDKSKNIFNLTFNIIFWIWMIWNWSWMLLQL